MTAVDDFLSADPPLQTVFLIQIHLSQMTFFCIPFVYLYIFFIFVICTK